MSNVELDLQAPRESSCPPEQSPRLSPTARGMKKAEQTLDIQTVGSDMIGIDQRLGFQEWLYLTLDRECTPVLYVYFAGIAILAVISAGIVVIVGLQCNWNFLAVN